MTLTAGQMILRRAFSTASAVTRSASASAARLGRYSPSTSAVFVCDLQEKFRDGVQYFPEIVGNTQRVMQMARILELPTMVTEQYPRGLGHTVPELELERHGLKPFEKTCFSMVLPDLMSALEDKQKDTKSIVLCGIETHACIYHTSLDLLDRGFDVHVVVDCCSSRSMTDRLFAFKRLEAMGAFLTTSECVILGMVADAAHPKFRQLQKIVFESAADTGLSKGL